MTTKPKKPAKSGREPVGRPAASPGYDDNYAIRMTPEDRKRWTELATASGMKLSQWIRYHCAKAAGADIAVISVEISTKYPPPMHDGDIMGGHTPTKAGLREIKERKAAGLIVDDPDATPNAARIVELENGLERACDLLESAADIIRDEVMLDPEEGEDDHIRGELDRLRLLAGVSDPITPPGFPGTPEAMTGPL